MKINSNLKVRNIAGESIVKLPSSNQNDKTKIIALNPTARLLWDNLFGKDFTVEDVTAILLENFEVEEAKASEDAATWVGTLQEMNVIQ